MRDAPLSAAQVAEITLQAVLRGTFYVLPHDDVRKGLARRAAAIVGGREPAMGRLPGSWRGARGAAMAKATPTERRPFADDFERRRA